MPVRRVAAPTTATVPAATKLTTKAKDVRKSILELKPSLLSHAMQLARSSWVAEDLVQDTVERAIRFQSRFEPGTNLRAWTHQILFSLFITHCRRGRREQVALESLTIDPCAWTLPEMTRAERHEISPFMARNLDRLPKEYRDLIVLVDLEEVSYKDASARMGIPVGTIMSRLHRARRMLTEVVRRRRTMRVGSSLEGVDRVMSTAIAA